MSLLKASNLAATILSCAAFLAIPAQVASGDPVATQEMGRNNEWVRQHLLAAPGQGPGFFSLIYGGRPSSVLLPFWNRQTRQNKIDDQQTELIPSWADPRTGLAASLDTLSPLAVLSHGYTLTRQADGKTLVLSPDEVRPDDLAHTRLHSGQITSRVVSTSNLPA